MAGRVVVLGSINVDLVVAVDHLPAPGETVLGGTFGQHFGGKGANQAVAAARAGATVTMIGAVGRDAHASASLVALAAEGIDTSHVREVEEPTGVALISVGPAGENQIVVAPGANALVGTDDLAGVLPGAGSEAGVLVSGFEVPLAVAAEAVRLAREAGWTAILNPAPAQPLTEELFALGAILVPNQHELCEAVGLADADRALDALATRNAGPVIVTRGAEGAILADGTLRRRVPAFQVLDVADTTGAGDTFVGVLAAWLAAGHPLPDAVAAANAAGALSVRHRGAREGMPRRAEIEAFMAGRASQVTAPPGAAAGELRRSG